MEVDLIIKNINVYNAYFKKFIYGDVAIVDDKFLYIGNINNIKNEELFAKEVIEGNGEYMIPGLIDIHMHIESSMTIPYQFSKAAVMHGTTTIVADPHEMANVFGFDGIRAMIDSNNQNAVDIFYGIPSSVPSTNKLLETTGGCINTDDVEELLKIEDICCLGEVMNFKDLINDDQSLINNIIRKIKKIKPHLKIEGHCPKIYDLDLAKYIYMGVDADHTEQTRDTLEEKIKNGMFIEIQEKSMKEENIKFLVDNNLYEHFCFVTDDVMADKLMEGHLNKIVKKAMKMGMPVEMAIYASTYTPARRMLLEDRGSIAPGKKADFIILKNIESFHIGKVYKNGKIVYDENIENKEDIEYKEIVYDENKRLFPDKFYNSVNLTFKAKEDFIVNTPINNGEIYCRAIEVKNNTTFTAEKKVIVEVDNGKLLWESSPYSLICVFERYGKTKNKAFGLVTGSVIKKGAIATTYAHDHHNLMVMGQNAEDMTIATNWIIENKGGYCVVEDGKIIAKLELPVGGIISEERIDILAGKVKNISDSMKAIGYEHHNTIMSFSTLSLPVSPSLKITDKGLINVFTQEIVTLFYDNQK